MNRILLLVIILILAGCSDSSPSTADSAPSSADSAPSSAAAATQAAPTATSLPPTATHTTMPAPSSTSTAAPSNTPTTAPTQQAPTPTAIPAVSAAWSYPIGTPGRVPGNGFVIRHGYDVENTWYNPGYWHTGEDWYAQSGDTAGAQVYAVADGDVVYVGSNYPGRVVIVRHADHDLFSMYGHLDPQVAVKQEQRVSRGQLLGTVLRRSDRTPNHLHFEIRTFLTTRAVNGEQPRYGFRCGRNCAPGPGYWPINAPDLPSALGWRNPTHVINGRAFPQAAGEALGKVVVATQPASRRTTVWSAPPAPDSPRHVIAELALESGASFPLLAIEAGREDSTTTSAEAYRVWYHIRLDDGQTGWVQAAAPSTGDTGSDGRPSSIIFNFYPAVPVRKP